MYVDVISARYLSEYKLEVTFEDGKSGVVDFKKFIHRGGVFERLQDLSLFRRFELNAELGIITWDNGIDIAPEVLYSEATGEPLPAWMQEEAVPGEAAQP